MENTELLLYHSLVLNSHTIRIMARHSEFCRLVHCVVWKIEQFNVRCKIISLAWNNVNVLCQPTVGTVSRMEDNFAKYLYDCHILQIYYSISHRILTKLYSVKILYVKHWQRKPIEQFFEFILSMILLLQQNRMLTLY